MQQNPDINKMNVAFAYLSHDDDPLAYYNRDLIIRGWYHIKFGECYSYTATTLDNEIGYYVFNAYYGEEESYYCANNRYAFTIGFDTSLSYFYDKQKGSSASTCEGLGSNYEEYHFKWIEIYTDSIITINLIR